MSDRKSNKGEMRLKKRGEEGREGGTPQCSQHLPFGIMVFRYWEVTYVRGSEWVSEWVGGWVSGWVYEWVGDKISFCDFKKSAEVGIEI